MTATSTTDRILVLDADLAPALSVARSLKEIGLVVDVASHVDKPLTGYSRVIDACRVYPDPLLHPDAFIAWMHDVTEAGRYALIIPVTERTLSPLLRQRERVDDRHIAMAPTESLKIALDKAATVALAESIGIPVPRSVRVATLDELPAARAQFDFPIVIKPVSSVGTDQARNVQLTVSYAFDDNELRAHVAHALRFGEVILQEYFRGDGEGIELLADHGEVVYAFQHRRLHEVPLTGGGSSLRMSVDITPALLDAARRLMAAMKWHGVAMVEFKHDPASGQFRLMEINGRFWGSLPLAAAAGANFPAMLYTLLCQGKAALSPPARAGVICRNLARDVDWFEHIARKNAPPRLVRIPSWRSVLKDTALCLHWRHRFDVQRLSDPLPGLVDMGRIVGSYWQRYRRLRADARLLAAQRAAWSNGTVRQALGSANRVLFVCHGNINRSAVAHYLASAALPETVRIDSAGFHAQGQRPADPVMVDVAQAHATDLSAWSSTHLTADMANAASIVFVMELAHLKTMQASFPDASRRTFLLGMADPLADENGEIPDPYGKPVAVYERVFDQVTRNVKALTAMLIASKT
ncbi:arsenate reductase/protein-tyrosine-phosphatase family protein [Denitromonas iodatirespirans]|uniref:protein-tyrosine-phosphatase n=1 Tax=Denitromonas iodatirespirans TaxID=2795389 RepID=A0A944D623_DENI1|nr:ATP-grasp domain-containing protein [Denitromonas iodatirespirans]MBT0960584.1 ATP-grasp domain-containing protein [Denitromonas iodatirespirans]